MKKSLLALAAMGAFAGAAHAQSSVTVSGMVEAGYTSKSVRAIGAANGAEVSQSSISNGHFGTPVLRVLGTEDLGGGMTAGFALTQEYATGTGAFSTSGGFTESFVSLGNNNFGTVFAGRKYAVTRDLGGVYRFMGDIGRFATPMHSTIQPNIVEFVTPSFQGISASVHYASPGKTVTTSVDTNVTPASQFGFGLSGTIGKARLAATMETLAFVSAVGSTDQAKNTITSIGGSYDFGVAQLGLAYVDQKVTTAASADAGKRNAYTVNLAAPVTKVITLGASYANYEVSPAAGGDKPKAIIMTFGAQYAFSKRTSIYGSYQLVTNSGANNALSAVTATGVNAGDPGASKGLGVVEINGGTGRGFGLTAVHTF